MPLRSQFGTILDEHKFNLLPEHRLPCLARQTANTQPAVFRKPATPGSLALQCQHGRAAGRIDVQKQTVQLRVHVTDAVESDVAESHALLLRAGLRIGSVYLGHRVETVQNRPRILSATQLGSPMRSETSTERSSANGWRSCCSKHTSPSSADQDQDGARTCPWLLLFFPGAQAHHAKDRGGCLDCVLIQLP